MLLTTEEQRRGDSNKTNPSAESQRLCRKAQIVCFNPKKWRQILPWQQSLSFCWSILWCRDAIEPAAKFNALWQGLADAYRSISNVWNYSTNRIYVAEICPPGSLVFL